MLSEILQVLSRSPTLASFVSLCVWFALLALVFVPLEHVLHRQAGGGLRRRQFANDAVYFFLSGFLPKILIIPMLAVAALLFAKLVPTGLADWAAGLPLWASLVLGMLISEVGFYWAHRWMHEIPLLWRFHAVHHSAEHIDWLVNTRMHPVDMVFTRLTGLVPLYAIGLAQSSTPAGQTLPLIVFFIGTFWGFFIHADMRLRLGPLEQLISTPAFHHWHHTRADHANHNYAPTFPWIDRLFGTLYLPKTWPAEYGTDTPVAPDLAGQLLDPFEGPPASRAA